MADTAKILAHLRYTAEDLGTRGSMLPHVQAIWNGIAEIERLTPARLSGQDEGLLDSMSVAADWVAARGQSNMEEVIRRAISVIERLTPKPMTRQEVADVLTDNDYLSSDSWEPLKDKDFIGFNRSYVLGEFVAYAVAEKIVREKEAARA